MSELHLIENINNIPIVPLRGIVMFPEMLLHFDVGRKKSVSALKAAMKNNQEVFLVARSVTHLLMSRIMMIYIKSVQSARLNRWLKYQIQKI